MPGIRLPEPPVLSTGGEEFGPAGEPAGLSPWLERPRLCAALDAAAGCPVTLVCAGAGWGKTAMLAQWRRASAEHTAMRWYGAGDPVERIVADLEAAEPEVVVIDDLDLLTCPALLATIERLIRERVRVVVSCRTPPPLPWHRWRVSGQLADIRSDELAFTLDETAALVAAHGLELTEAELAELHELTEGWPAGLRLAALEVRDHSEPGPAIAELGRDDLIAEYLNAEVLAGLPGDTRILLGTVSVAGQVTAGLVDAVTGRPDGERVLADLDRLGTVLHRQPGPGGWYRFHPLLNRLLYAQLRRHDPAGVAVAHRRAAGWHIAHGPPVEALRHLLVAGDWDTAVETLERQWPDITAGSRRRGANQAVPVPPDGLDARPRLALAFAAERLDAADPVEARRYLRLAVVRPAEVPAPLLLALRLADARLAGDLDRVLELGGQLLALPPGTPDRRALGLLATGRAQLQLGRYAPAAARLGDGLRLAGQTDAVAEQICAGSHVALGHAYAGRLRAAVRTAREALALAGRVGLTGLSDLGWARLAMAVAYHHWDRLREAHRAAGEAVEHAYGDPQMLVAVAVVQARIWAAAGRLGEAHEVLLGARQEAAGTRVSGPVRGALRLVEAELRLAGGDLAAARRLLGTGRRDGPVQPWTDLLEASVLLAEGKAATAAGLVAPLLSDPELPSLTWRAQAGVVTALAGSALHDRARTAHGLDVALDAAEQEGYRRMFVAGGPALRELLATAAPDLGVYRLVASELARIVDGPPPGLDQATPARPWPGSALVEPLTERELTVLRYLQGDLSNEEIGAVLCVSVNTIKTHVKNIYRKLDAVRRREAVQRARDLRLI